MVIGGTGLIGSKLVTKLNAVGHEAVAASPNSGLTHLRVFQDTPEKDSVVMQVKAKKRSN